MAQNRQHLLQRNRHKNQDPKCQSRQHQKNLRQNWPPHHFRVAPAPVQVVWVLSAFQGADLPGGSEGHAEKTDDGEGVAEDLAEGAGGDPASGAETDTDGPTLLDSHILDTRFLSYLWFAWFVLGKSIRNHFSGAGKLPAADSVELSDLLTSVGHVCHPIARRPCFPTKRLLSPKPETSSLRLDLLFGNLWARCFVARIPPKRPSAR